MLLGPGLLYAPEKASSVTGLLLRIGHLLIHILGVLMRAFMIQVTNPTILATAIPCMDTPNLGLPPTLAQDTPLLRSEAETVLLAVHVRGQPVARPA